MAVVLLKHLKFPKLFRLSFKNINPVYFEAHKITLKSQLQNHKIFYATAAVKPVSSNDYAKEVRSNITTKEADIYLTIDEALADIDFSVKRKGRVLSKNVSNVLSMISHADANLVTSTHGLYLLRACKYIIDIPRKERQKLVNEIWNKFQELDKKFDIRHYNALLDVHIINGFDFEPANIVASIEDQNLEPNITTQLCLLRKYCKDGNLEGASEIIEYIKEKGISANEEIFNCLIEAHVRNGDFAGAHDVVDVMRTSNLKLSGDTYTILACGYATKGNIKEVMSCLNAANKETYLSGENFVQVIKTLATSGHSQYIDEVISFIKAPHEYQPEFINAAIELIHEDCVDIAYKLFVASDNPFYEQNMNIFIKQLIQSGKPISQILQYYRDIKSEGRHNVRLFNLIRTAADYGKIDHGLELLEEMVNEGQIVRCSHFEMLFQRVKENGSESFDCILKILKKMYKLGVPAEYITYMYFILPDLPISKPADFISAVEDSGQDVSVAAEALFAHYCNLGDIDSAYNLTHIVPFNLTKKFDFKNFLDRFEKWNKSSASFSGNAYLKILQYVFKNAKYDDVRGMFLAQTILTSSDVYEIMLRKIENREVDFGFNEKTFAACRNYLYHEDPTSLVKLSKLRSRMSNYQTDMTLEKEKMELDHLNIQNLPCKSFLFERIMFHARRKNAERVKELLSIYDSYGFTYSPTFVTHLLTLYCFVCDLEKADEMILKLKEFPNFKIDINRILDYSSLLIKFMKYGEAYEALKTHVTKPYMFNNKGNTLNNIKKFFTSISDTADPEFVKKVQSHLFPLHEVLNSKHVFLEPLINIHIVRNDLVSAYEQYKYCVVNHRAPILLNNLLKRCIVLDDKDTLQKVIDITDSYIGKNIASIELLVALLETGHYMQADKVIKNLGNQADSEIIQGICRRLITQNRVSTVEMFIKATKGLTISNRDELYHILLRHLADLNDYKKAIEVFRKLKSEFPEPSSEAVMILMNLLKKNNQPLSREFFSSSSSASLSETDASLSEKYTENFINFLKNGDVEMAINEISSMKKGYIYSLPFCHISDFMQLCLEHNRTRDISSHLHLMPFIIENAKEILKPVLEKYSSLGDVKTLTAISNFMPDFALMEVNFNFYYCNSFIRSGRYEDLITELEKHFGKKNKLFSFAAFEELVAIPEYWDRVHNLAVKYYEVKFDTPIAAIWAHKFCNGDYTEAKEIFKVYPFEVERVDPSILRTIKSDKNVELGKEYVKFVKELTVKKRTKERAYGTLLDVLVAEELYDDAAALVVESQNLQLKLDKYYRSSVIALETALKKENKDVPFSISSEDSSPETQS